MAPQNLSRTSVVAILALGFAVVGAASQTTGRHIFSTPNTCELAVLLTPQECRTAHANALAELDEKSPRYSSRAECQKDFKQCMIAGFDRGRVEFEPALRGFEVNVRSMSDKTVTPVIDGDRASLGFSARTVLSADTSISHSLRAQALARWMQAQKARAAVAAAASTSSPLIDSPPAALPPSPADDLAAATRRRNEIHNAPTVY